MDSYSFLMQGRELPRKRSSSARLNVMYNWVDQHLSEFSDPWASLPIASQMWKDMEILSSPVRAFQVTWKEKITNSWKHGWSEKIQSERIGACNGCSWIRSINFCRALPRGGFSLWAINWSKNPKRESMSTIYCNQIQSQNLHKQVLISLLYCRTLLAGQFSAKEEKRGSILSYEI